MTVPFSKEKEVLDQLTQAIELANKLRLGLSKMILEKGVHQKRILSKELQEKCQRIGTSLAIISRPKHRQENVQVQCVQQRVR